MIPKYLVDKYNRESCRAPARKSTSNCNGSSSRSWVKGGRIFSAETFDASLRRRRSPYFGQSDGVIPEGPPREALERDREVQRRDQAGVWGVGRGALEVEVSGRDEVTIADPSFIPWNAAAVNWLIADIDTEKNHPALAR